MRMLIRVDDLERIQSGVVDTAFRRWTRPTVKAGGTLTTAIGMLAIDAVDTMSAEELSLADVRRAGFDDVAGLMAWLDSGKAGTLYRIRLHYLGEDPRIGLRESADDLEAVEAALAKLDARGAWTERVLRLIETHPGRLAQLLADEMGLEKLKFKGKVRQLKALGLTESRDIGYRLSRRGEALLARRRTIASA
jgi:hypothetical protein